MEESRRSLRKNLLCKLQKEIRIDIIRKTAQKGGVEMKNFLFAALSLVSNFSKYKENSPDIKGSKSKRTLSS